VGGALFLDGSLEYLRHANALSKVHAIIKEQLKEGEAEPPGWDNARLEVINELMSAAEESGLQIAVHLFRDIGIALLVAVVLVLLLERANRRLIDREFEERLRKVSTRTIAGVCGNDLPPSIFEATPNQIYEQPLIRENFRIEITLWKLDPDIPKLIEAGRELIRNFISESAGLGISLDKLVACEMNTSYRIRNVSSKEQEFKPPFKIERYFPSSGVETCRVDKVRIGFEDVRDKCSWPKGVRAFTNGQIWTNVSPGWHTLFLWVAPHRGGGKESSSRRQQALTEGVRRFHC
jgi:hypothetical protein